MDALDKAIVNHLQGGFPIVDRPYAEAAQALGTTEGDLLDRLASLLERGILSRFGPMYHAERLGGSLILTAMQVPDEDFERVAAIVNAMPAIAHNYERAHALNMWFVVATETPDEAQATLDAIAEETGYPVYPMPKLKEFFVGLRLEA
ncbi:Lrp/AsnC family transcriptional regulator [bacterium]|nr:Lrp/AsnC family transcriptional regulator [bacterium]